MQHKPEVGWREQIRDWWYSVQDLLAEKDVCLHERKRVEIEIIIKNQIQNTRKDWLRSEIEKLEEGIEIPDTIQMDAEEYWEGNNQALASIITRYKEELLELESK